MREELYLWTNS